MRRAQIMVEDGGKKLTVTPPAGIKVHLWVYFEGKDRKAKKFGNIRAKKVLTFDKEVTEVEAFHGQHLVGQWVKQ